MEPIGSRAIARLSTVLKLKKTRYTFEKESVLGD
jgi:hypothetical protein